MMQILSQESMNKGRLAKQNIGAKPNISASVITNLYLHEFGLRTKMLIKFKRHDCCQGTYATLGKLKAGYFIPVSFLACSSALNMEVTYSCQWSADELQGVVSLMSELYFLSCSQQGIFSTPLRPDRLWGPPSLSNWYRGLSRRG